MDDLNTIIGLAVIAGALFWRAYVAASTLTFLREMRDEDRETRRLEHQAQIRDAHKEQQ